MLQVSRSPSRPFDQGGDKRLLALASNHRTECPSRRGRRAWLCTCEIDEAVAVRLHHVVDVDHQVADGDPVDELLAPRPDDVDDERCLDAVRSETSVPAGAFGEVTFECDLLDRRVPSSASHRCRSTVPTASCGARGLRSLSAGTRRSCSQSSVASFSPRARRSSRGRRTARGRRPAAWWAVLRAGAARGAPWRTETTRWSTRGRSPRAHRRRPPGTGRASWRATCPTSGSGTRWRTDSPGPVPRGDGRPGPSPSTGKTFPESKVTRHPMLVVGLRHQRVARVLARRRPAVRAPEPRVRERARVARARAGGRRFGRQRGWGAARRGGEGRCGGICRHRRHRRGGGVDEHRDQPHRGEVDDVARVRLSTATGSSTGIGRTSTTSEPATRSCHPCRRPDGSIAAVHARVATPSPKVGSVCDPEDQLAQQRGSRPRPAYRVPARVGPAEPRAGRFAGRAAGQPEHDRERRADGQHHGDDDRDPGRDLVAGGRGGSTRARNTAAPSTVQASSRSRAKA